MRLRQRPRQQIGDSIIAHSAKKYVGERQPGPQSAVHRRREETSVMQYSCPTCGSQNTQRLSTAYMSGVSEFSAVTGGIGWTGPPAIGGAWTTGTSQTQLSA